MFRDAPLPAEILVEILWRLPVKPLLRFKCVSKSWLKLITSPDFVKLHLKQSLQINPKILFPTYQDTYSIDYETSCYDPKEYDFPLNDQTLIGCCNGIVCLSDKEFYMALWNPATSEYLDIPFASVDEDLIDDERDVIVGFGYDPIADKYKVVKSVFFYRDAENYEVQQCEAKIYTLGTDEEWRRIDNPPCCLCDRHMAPLVNGALHWLAGKPIGSVKLDSKIISFHVGSEEFDTIPWINATDGRDVTLGVLQGCLSMLVCCPSEHSGHPVRIDVWSMKDYGVKESWTKLISVQMPISYSDFGSIEPLVLRSNGEMLLKFSAKLYSYNTVTNTISDHEICDIPYCCYTAHIYVESLVSIAALVKTDAS